MTSTQLNDGATRANGAATMDMKLEVVLLPVADVDRAKQFYAGPGLAARCRLPGRRRLPRRPAHAPGSDAAIIFGDGVTSAAPGSIDGLQLVVSDIEAARAELAGRGVDISEVFHDAGGVFHHAGTEARVPGPAPERGSYGSFASFSDPDGNGWILQEVTARLPGRVAGETTYGSASDLSQALQRAALAHGEHEKRTGEHDEQWPDWYAEYMVRERAGEELPT